MSDYFYKHEPPYDNDFLDGLEYPMKGEPPFPFHDTGIKAKGKTYTADPWDEIDDSAEDYEEPEPPTVTGELLIRPSPFGGYHCSINGEFVNPATVEAIKED